MNDWMSKMAPQACRAPAGESSLVFISPTELHTRKITHGSLLTITHVLPPELVAQRFQPLPTIAVAVSDPSVPLGLISAHPTLFSNTVLSPLDAADPTPHVNAKVAPESVRITPLPSLPMASRVLVIVNRVRPSTEAALHALLRPLVSYFSGRIRPVAVGDQYLIQDLLLQVARCTPPVPMTLVSDSTGIVVTFQTPKTATLASPPAAAAVSTASLAPAARTVTVHRTAPEEKQSLPASTSGEGEGACYTIQFEGETVNQIEGHSPTASAGSAAPQAATKAKASPDAKTAAHPQTALPPPSQPPPKPDLSLLLPVPLRTVGAAHTHAQQQLKLDAKLVPYSPSERGAPRAVYDSLPRFLYGHSVSAAASAAGSKECAVCSRDAAEGSTDEGKAPPKKKPNTSSAAPSFASASPDAPPS